jgi:hypothetical protein
VVFSRKSGFILQNKNLPSKSSQVSNMVMLVKNISILAIILMALVTSEKAFAQVAGEMETDSGHGITVGFESDFASKYIWRGLAFSRGNVSQNSVWLTKGGLTGSIWSNYDAGSEDVDPRLNEFDFGLAYETSFHNLSVEGMIGSYVYPNQPETPSTDELSLNLSYGLPLIQPFTIQTVDIKEYRGAYFGELGLQASRDITGNLSADMTAEIGWGSAKFNHAYIGDVGAAFQLASCQANLTWGLYKSLYLRPHFWVTTLINNDIRDLVEKPTLYQFGLAFGGEF